MLVQQSKEFVELLERRNDLERDRTALEGFKARQEMFAGVVKELSPLVSSLQSLRRKGIATEELNAAVGDVLKLVQKVDKNFRERPDWVLQPPNFSFQVFNQTLLSLCNNIRFSLRQSWGDYTARRVPKIDNELLTVLKDIGDLGGVVGRIEALSARVDTAKGKVPQREDEVDDFEELVADLIKAWDSLESDDMPQSVRVFLKEATSGGAPFSLLTEEVRSWLDKTQSTLSGRPLSESFRVISLARLEG